MAGYHAVDLRHPDAIDAAVEAIGGTIDALFNCAGLPGGRFSDLDTMTVNFAAIRHLTELVVEHMAEGAAIASISSGAGAGWMATSPSGCPWSPATASPRRSVARGQPEEIASGYVPSKEVIIVWTIWRSFELASRVSASTAPAPGRPTRR